MRNFKRTRCCICGEECEYPKPFVDIDGYNKQICNTCYTLVNDNRAEADAKSYENKEV